MQRFTSVLRLVTGFLVMVLYTLVFLVIALLLLPSRAARIKACNYYGKALGRSIVAIAGVTPIIRHRERLNGFMPAIYLSNHASNIDAFIGMWLCPVGAAGVAKKEIARVPFFGWLYLLSGHPLIDRQNRENAIASLESVAQVVRSHRLGIYMFPEGTRSKDGRLLPLKKGFVHMAIATGLPVVPVVVHGSHKSWKKHEFTFTPCTVYVDVLEKVDTSSWRAETAEQHCAQIHRLYVECLEPEQRPVGWSEGEMGKG